MTPDSSACGSGAADAVSKGCLSMSATSTETIETTCLERAEAELTKPVLADIKASILLAATRRRVAAERERLEKLR